MTTRDEAVRAAADVLASATADWWGRTDRENAEAAYVPGGPSVDDLEHQCRDIRQRITATSKRTA